MATNGKQMVGEFLMEIKERSQVLCLRQERAGTREGAYREREVGKKLTPSKLLANALRRC